MAESGPHDNSISGEDEQELYPDSEFAGQVLKNIGEGLAITDRDEKFIFVNPAFLEMTGFKREDVIGEDSKKLVFEKDYESVDRALDKRIKKGKSVYEIPLRKKNGGSFIAHITSVSRWKNDKFVGSIAIIRDLSSQRETEEELRKAKEKAEESGRAKERFIASMSHEIRTPMSGVLGMAELLDKTDLDQEQQDYVDAIRLSARSLINILSDVIDYSSTSKTEVRLVQEPFKIRECLNKLYRSFEHRKEKEGISFTLTIEDDVPEKVIGDRERYLHIVMHILGNAFKFTREGEISIRLGVDRKTKNKIDIVTQVKDTGMGIPKELSDSIFESFSKSAESRMSSYGGTGLGLSIVKRLVKLMDGSIDLESEENKGTVFTVKLPFRISDSIIENDEAVDRDESWQSGLEGKKVLIVDDHPINRKLLEGLLKKSGFEFLKAESGAEALEVLQDEEVDLILMDVHMPGMDGLEATKKIRSEFSEPKSRVPVIAVSASVMEADMKACRKAGMNAFISKPYTHNELINTVEETLQGTGLQGEKNKFRQEQEEIIDLSSLREMADGDLTMVLDMIELFLDQTPRLLDQAEDHLRDKNWQKLGETVHTLKPTLSYMGMDRLVPLILELEKFKNPEIVPGSSAEIKEKIVKLRRSLEKAYGPIQSEAEKLRSPD